MNLFINGVDIYKDVSVNYCTHEMFAEKQADGLVIRFNDTKGAWSKWQPAEGAVIRLKEGAADTGKMFIHSMTSENGLYTIRALSLPLSGKTKRSKSWEGVRFFQLGREIAAAHGLTFQTYGCTDQVYPYMVQDRETDFALFSRICALESCQMIIYDGRLLAYSEPAMESKAPAGSLLVDQNGHFSYHDDRAACFGSCEINCGDCSGSFKAPSAISSAILRPEGVKVSSSGEAARFAKGLLRNVNKYGRTGRFSRSLLPGYAAASLLKLETKKASAWNGTVFVYKVRHDFVGNKTTLYFRNILEGY